MNIFYLDRDLVKSAQAHVDKHIVKMPLETAQLLCTARHELGGTPEHIPYRKTHVNHPCSVWARESYANYQWLCGMGIELCKEYTYRYGKVHKCQAVIENCIENTPEPNVFTYLELTEFPQAMDEEYKMDDPVLGYRNYYRYGKAHLHNWKNRPTPTWIN
tara:strand:+ start:5591 stop:6070 length:480 start_codon:yes stop_codon:yes gene_type:complete